MGGGGGARLVELLLQRSLPLRHLPRLRTKAAPPARTVSADSATHAERLRGCSELCALCAGGGAVASAGVSDAPQHRGGPASPQAARSAPPPGKRGGVRRQFMNRHAPQPPRDVRTKPIRPRPKTPPPPECARERWALEPLPARRRRRGGPAAPPSVRAARALSAPRARVSGAEVTLLSHLKVLRAYLALCGGERLPPDLRLCQQLPPLRLEPLPPRVAPPSARCGAAVAARAT
jgi:hypothetical protein